MLVRPPRARRLPIGKSDPASLAHPTSVSQRSRHRLQTPKCGQRDVTRPIPAHPSQVWIDATPIDIVLPQRHLPPK